MSDIPSHDELEELRALISKKISQSESIDEEIDGVNKNLLAVPSEEKIKDIVLELNKNQIDKSKLEAKNELLNQILSEITYDQERVAKEISAKLASIANQETNLIVSQRILKHAQKSKETLSKFKHQHNTWKWKKVK